MSSPDNAGHREGAVTRCECEVVENHPSSPDGRCDRDGDGAERMTDGRVSASPALCIPCLFGCSE